MEAPMSVRHEAESHTAKSTAIRASIDARRQEISAQTIRQPQAPLNAPRCSPDPNAGTDRYRLAAPFSFKL